MKKRVRTLWATALLIGAAILAACQAKTVTVREHVEVERAATRIVEREISKNAEPDRTKPLPASTATPSPTNVPVVPVYGGETLPNGEAFDSMFFEGYGTNPFIDTEDDPLSTFSMDVDTASYTIARRYIEEGHLPPRDAVRVEEFVNYFEQNYPAPREGEGAFAIHLEGAPAPFGQAGEQGTPYYLLRVGIQGRQIHSEDRKDAVLTFVIDVSGSMDRENRLGLVKRSLLYLVDQLRPTDQVGIVAYGSQAVTVLRPTSARDKVRILDAINGLYPGGSTYAEAGLREGYRMANRAFEPEAINRVILCSDGVANVGRTGADDILKQIEEYADQGIALSTVGFGLGNYNDVLMEKLADQGDGNYAYVDTLDEARRIFVENLTGTLQVIARDAKIQVAFDPQVVSRYRLLGYENRDVADQDFRNDAVDAGEVGAGHSVTALYEIKFHPNADSDWGRALTVRVRYQDPDTGEVREIARELWGDEFHPDLRATSPTWRLTAAVAEYAEILRGSYWARGSSLQDVLSLARQAGAELDDRQAQEQADEFLSLVRQASRLAQAP